MENRLQTLYSLQLVDLQLDELQEQKGDLPKIVEDLTESLRNKTAEKKRLEDTIKSNLKDRDKADSEIIDLKEKIEKYKTQQFQVKTNKQYDSLAREIDFAQEKVIRLQKDMEDLENKTEQNKVNLENLTPKIEALQEELNERKKELSAVNKEHEEEETELNHKRNKLIAKISKTDLQMYKKIRDAKGGKAIVKVLRNACGGCFNLVTPQKMLELRKNSTIMACEGCGRILISDDIATIAEKNQ